jgi:glycosyltransferase involved in cell wall biosynthesis
MIKPKLSIMLITCANRVQLLNDLIQELERQTKGLPVEILYLGDNRYITVGGKRNRLKRMAVGDYSCWIDDDDWIAPTYVEDILRGIEHDPDVVTFTNKVTQGADEQPHPMVHRCFFSVSHRQDRKDMQAKEYFFKPCHLHPIKKEYVDQVDFVEGCYCRSDHTWAGDVFQYLKKEYKIDKELYIHRTNKLSEPRMRVQRIGELFDRG